MCFSASVSYTAAALLVPAGVYGIRQSARTHEPYWMIALIPLLFGIQQGLEGGIWQSLSGDSDSRRHWLALGFLFFSHFFWLWWVPLSSSRVESDPVRRRMFLFMAVIGILGGSVLYIPLLINPEWLAVSVKQHSIVYTVKMLHDAYLPSGLDRSLYALIVLVPLIYSSHQHLRLFGGLVAMSLLFSVMIYEYAFVSVWCFFAAILSVSILRMMAKLCVMHLADAQYCQDG